jgi:hypothetical protein
VLAHSYFVALREHNFFPRDFYSSPASEEYVSHRTVATKSVAARGVDIGAHTCDLDTLEALHGVQQQAPKTTTNAEYNPDREQLEMLSLHIARPKTASCC